VDPLESKFGGRTPYCYAANNPVIFNDPSGKQEEYEKYTRPDGKAIYLSPQAQASVAKEGEKYVFYDKEHKPTDFRGCVGGARWMQSKVRCLRGVVTIMDFVTL